MPFIIFSEIVLGEYIVNQDPDCDGTNTNCNPTVIRRGIKQIIVHDTWKLQAQYMLCTQIVFCFHI